jgi:hypothetical protein
MALTVLPRRLYLNLRKNYRSLRILVVVINLLIDIHLVAYKRTSASKVFFSLLYCFWSFLPFIVLDRPPVLAPVPHYLAL